VQRATLLAAWFVGACTTASPPVSPLGAPETEGAASSKPLTCSGLPLETPAPAPSAVLAARRHQGHGPQFLQALHPDTSIWFNLADMDHPLDLPAGATLVAVTRTTQWAVLQDRALALRRQGQRAFDPLPMHLSPTDAVETDAGDLWALARSSDPSSVEALDRADDLSLACR
jgi:hypothetical protein